MQQLLAARRFADAAGALIAAADAGDGDALAEAAQWRIVGNVIRRDLGAARDLLRRAWAAGRADAGLLYASFLASGVGGGHDWRSALTALRALTDLPAARGQIDLIEAMELTDDGDPVAPIAGRRLSASPDAMLSDALLTAAECEYLRRAGEPLFQPSLISDPETGRMMPHPIRRSDAAMFGVFAEDVAIHAINRRIGAFAGLPVENGEPLQLLRYRPGDEYRAHLDVLPAEPNQRVATVLVYLSDDYDGGETRFLRSALDVRGRVGDALLFRNVTATGAPDVMAEHAGRPVTRGVKCIASRWIRARRFTYPPPRPLVDR